MSPVGEWMQKLSVGRVLSLRTDTERRCSLEIRLETWAGFRRRSGCHRDCFAYVPSYILTNVTFHVKFQIFSEPLYILFILQIIRQIIELFLATICESFFPCICICIPFIFPNSRSSFTISSWLCCVLDDPLLKSVHAIQQKGFFLAVLTAFPYNPLHLKCVCRLQYVHLINFFGSLSPRLHTLHTYANSSESIILNTHSHELSGELDSSVWIEYRPIAQAPTILVHLASYKHLMLLYNSVLFHLLFRVISVVSMDL